MEAVDPRLDANAEAGMAVTVGRIRAASPPHDLAFVVVAHNGVRGAAGACLANAELYTARYGAAFSVPAEPFRRTVAAGNFPLETKRSREERP